jgi:hypothetical protein
MIRKERDPHDHAAAGPMAEAGARAEETLAFYLRRVFERDPNIWIFHDLRFEGGGDARDVAQIDHLVLHRHGFVVVESKSVTTRVRVNELGEWSRYWKRWDGMRSPVQQARLQIELLRRALNENCERLIGKYLGLLQMGFSNCPFEVLVAISDGGVIERETDVPELIKADQVPDRIRAIYRRHRNAASLLNLSVKNLLDFSSNDGVYKFRDEEMEAISAWLLENHRPKTNGRKTSPPVSPVPPASTPPAPASPANIQPATSLGICSKCGTQASILWGKSSYYWKCPACGHNMPIRLTCPTCSRRMKIRKDKTRFFQRCEPCGTESLYHDATALAANPAAGPSR